jgi:hypothetical protein
MKFISYESTVLRRQYLDRKLPRTRPVLSKHYNDLVIPVLLRPHFIYETGSAETRLASIT